MVPDGQVTFENLSIESVQAMTEAEFEAILDRCEKGVVYWIFENDKAVAVLMSLAHYVALSSPDGSGE